MTSVMPHPEGLHYFDLPRYWTRDIVPHLSDKKLNKILVRDFNKYTMGRWGKQFAHGDYPAAHDCCYWNLHHRGRIPRYWDYVCSGACHWLVNFTLRLATLVRPKSEWRIITSDRHSTVWDGRKTLFEFNFLAFGTDPNECFEMAYGRELAVGTYYKVLYPGPWWEKEPSDAKGGVAA